MRASFYRRKIRPLWITGVILFWGIIGMGRKAIAAKKEIVISLDGAWRFKTDPDKDGVKKNWHQPEFNDQSWSTITVPSVWEKEIGDFDGVAWYRTQIDSAAFTNGDRIALSFGAVDDQCEVWLNGKKLGEHTGWNEPFYFDVTELLKKDGPNSVAVKVLDWGGDGGIWKPVRLRTFTDEEDLLKGEYFDKKAIRSSEWVKDAVIYELYPRAFCPDGKFTTIESRLEEIKNLGATCIWFMPINPVGQLNAKGSLGCPYSVKDYYGVNLEYGTKDSFKHLVKEAHELGLKVIIDWVANHTAWDNAMLKSNPEWYLHDKSGKIVPPNPDWADVAGLNYRLNGSAPSPAIGLRKYMKGALIHWVQEYEIDGFRCDVADMLPVDFWEDVRAALSKIKPDVMMLAEGDRPEDHLASFDLTYAWNVYDAMANIVNGKADASTIDAALKREYYKYPKGSLRLRFSENHDKWRAMKVFGPAHYAAACLIFTLDGVPLIYNGQEVGDDRQPSLFEKELIDWKGAKIGKQKAVEIRKFYKRLIAFRKNHPSLNHGQRFKVHTSDDRQVFAFVTSYRDDAVLVAINFSPKEFSGTIDLPEIFLSENGKLAAKPLFDGGNLGMKNGSNANLQLTAWGYQIWTVR